MTDPADIPGPRILIVDDDKALRHFLHLTLSARGYSILEAGTATGALEIVVSGHPDVIVLDLGLPDHDGIEVTRTIREWSHTPILILSVRDQEEEKIAALGMGADDYLTKPFGAGELVARIQALLRRAAGTKPGTPFRSGDLEVDLIRRVVKVRDRFVQLTPTEYELMKNLVQAGGKLVTHQQLLQQVWGPGAMGDAHLLRVNISTLRRKLQPDPGGSDYILTESRVGYRLRIDE
jgi:two-component system, OmpR family, KDP operon response regulator KdpE